MVRTQKHTWPDTPKLAQAHTRRNNVPGYALGNFLVYVLLNTFTPGPGNILALNTATNYGWRKGRPLYLGIFAGYLLIQALAICFVLGLGSVLPDVLHGSPCISPAANSIPRSGCKAGRRPFPWDSFPNW